MRSNVVGAFNVFEAARNCGRQARHFGECF